MAGKLTVYGLDVSQPCRTVTWLLRMHGVPFEYVRTNPGSPKGNGSRAPEYLEKLYAAGTVPVLKETFPDGREVVIAESAAIATYLAETRGWDDVYPLGADKAAERAKSNQWTHWAHKNVRHLTQGHFATIMRPDIKFSPGDVETNKRTGRAGLKTMERVLGKSKFLTGDQARIGDVAVFADVGQLQDLDLFDFSEFPNVKRWMADMRKLPAYEETHAPVFKMISPAIDKGKKMLAEQAAKAKM
ncbi:glutathione S-transferase [Hyaloraphidium curvatum]|nr:glutathione S-transferase [Hyaloraphidium curvatum]